MKYARNAPATSKKKLLISALVVAVLATTGLLLYLKNQSRSTPVSTEDTIEKIDLSPPTKEEEKAADTQKEENVQQKEQDDATRSGVKQVTPIITSAGHYGDYVEVRSFVPGIYEEGRYCKVTFTKDGSAITRNVDAIKDATTTRCDVAAVPRSEFASAGTWSVVVSYASPTAAGSSETKQIEVK